MTRYYEWDHDAGEVIKYRRDGECAQCGECCRAFMRFSFIKPPRRNNPRNGGPTTSGRGVWQEIDQGRWRYFFKLEEVELGKQTCPQLTQNGLCKEHTTKDHVCAWWPFSPRCLQPFPECGYSFQELNRWRIEDL